MSNDRDSEQYQYDYQRGRDRIRDVQRRRKSATQSLGSSDGSELGGGPTDVHSTRLPLQPPSSGTATTTAVNRGGTRYMEGYLRARATIRAHNRVIPSTSDTGVPGPSHPAAALNPMIIPRPNNQAHHERHQPYNYHGQPYPRQPGHHYSHLEGVAGARAEGEEEKDQFPPQSVRFVNSDDDDGDGTRHRDRDRHPSSHRGQSQERHHPPAAQPSHSRTDRQSRGVSVFILSTLLTLFYRFCLGNKKRTLATLLLALYLLGPHHGPIFGGFIVPLGRAGLSFLWLCLQRLLVDALLRAAGVDPSIAVCDSNSYGGNGGSGGHGSGFVNSHEHTHRHATYLRLLEANGWNLENRWDGDGPLMTLSMLSSKASSSPSSSSDGTTPAQARQDLIADYESLITVLRMAILTSSPRSPNNVDLVGLVEAELRRELGLSRRGLDDAGANLGRELAAAADAASDARRWLLFLNPVCRPACYLARLQFTRFKSCAEHSLGVQLAGRFKMATCAAHIDDGDGNMEGVSCIRDPWDLIVTTLERMLGAWQDGSTALRESDARLLAMMPRIDAMLLPQIQQGFLALLEGQTAAAAATTTTTGPGDGRNGAHDGAKANQARAAFKLAPHYVRHLLAAHCTQLCDLLFADAQSLPDSCVRYRNDEHTDDENNKGENDSAEDDNSGLDWTQDAQALLHRAREARASQYGGLVAWRIDGPEVLRALADVEVLARIAGLRARRL